MKIRSLLIFLVVCFSVGLAFYINKRLQKWIQPRKSLARLGFYIFSAFALVFIYAFLLVWAIAHIFPLQ